MLAGLAHAVHGHLHLPRSRSASYWPLWLPWWSHAQGGQLRLPRLPGTEHPRCACCGRHASRLRLGEQAMQERQVVLLTL